MNPREQGFLLLTSHLGNPERRVLTVPQMRQLSRRVRQRNTESRLRDLTVPDVMALGYDRDFAMRVLALLSEEDLLTDYCTMAERKGCFPLTRVTAGYPRGVHHRLGMDSPGCLWYQGDPAILQSPMVSVVGSRELREDNRCFAVLLGQKAAQAGVTVVSGNARGADQTVQQACLDAGGSVISVVADCLADHPKREGMLYLSEDGYDCTFSSQRALSRNRVIHTMSAVTVVVQSSLEKGGTWSGTVSNLKQGWSPVFCYNDGSEAVCRLLQMGAGLMDVSDLERFPDFHSQKTLFDMADELDKENET